MAGYKGHITGAIVLGGAYTGALELAARHQLVATSGLTLEDWQLLAGLFVITVLFGLFPDVDTNSKGQHVFYALAAATDVLLIASGRLEAAAYLGLLAMAPAFSKHRGWTHSFLAMALVPAPIILAAYLYRPAALPTALILYGAAVVGYFSHLLLDGKVSKHIAIHSKPR
jgi:membrane-bound metal-dependent hydrolase YbcI (DUF457 family)